MRVVNVRELHLRTGAIVDLAANGTAIAVVRRGVTVAELRPASRRPAKRMPERARLLSRYPELAGDSGRFLETDRS
jgi:antitoxin (DNA-binding transcriptional repressor) of toxin-antitoxin stability system